MGQSLARMYLHAVFSTRNREPLLADPWREEMFAVLGGIAGNVGCPSLVVGGMADHVHVLIELGRANPPHAFASRPAHPFGLFLNA